MPAHKQKKKMSKEDGFTAVVSVRTFGLNFKDFLRCNPDTSIAVELRLLILKMKYGRTHFPVTVDSNAKRNPVMLRLIALV